MKRFFGFALILGLLSIPAFAAKNAQNINFPEKLTVGTTQLPAGDYKVTWTGTGPTVQVTLVQKNVSHPLTSTLPAKLVDVSNGHTGLTFANENGANVLQTIQLNKINLVFSAAPAEGQ